MEGPPTDSPITAWFIYKLCLSTVSTHRYYSSLTSTLAIPGSNRNYDISL